MIQLLNESHTHVMGYFQNYNELADYIQQTEASRIRMLAAICLDLNYPCWDREYWGFTVYAHETLKTTYAAMKKPPLTETEREAFQRGLDLLEIHYGDGNNPVQIMVTEDVDIESLRKEWCLSYCKARHYAILDPERREPETSGNTTGGGHDLAL